MRLTKNLVAVAAVLFAGWCLLAYVGLGNIARDRASGWSIDQMPAHPALLGAIYLAMMLALPMVAALLTAPPGKIAGATFALWNRFWFRAIVSAICGLLAAALLAFATIGLMDAGIL